MNDLDFIDIVFLLVLAVLAIRAFAWILGLPYRKD